MSQGPEDKESDEIMYVKKIDQIRIAMTKSPVYVICDRI